MEIEFPSQIDILLERGKITDEEYTRMYKELVEFNKQKYSRKKKVIKKYV